MRAFYLRFADAVCWVSAQGGRPVQTANSFGFLPPFDYWSMLTSHMRIALLILCAVIVTAIITYWISIPRNSHYVFSRPGGGLMTLSRTGVSFESAPDHYASNGFDHLEPYISRLLATTNGYRFLHIFTPDGKRGFGFSARNWAILEVFPGSTKVFPGFCVDKVINASKISATRPATPLVRTAHPGGFSFFNALRKAGVNDTPTNRDSQKARANH
jgi:hypothetical protein